MHIKPLFWIGISLISVGVCLAGSGIATGALQPAHWKEKQNLTDITVTPEESVSTILIDTTAADVVIQSGDVLSVSAQNVNADHFSTEISDQTLYIRQSSPQASSWYNWIDLSGIYGMQSKITLTLPENTASVLSVDQDYGDISVDNLSLSTLSVNSSCGDIAVSSSDIQYCTIESAYGDTTLTQCSVAESLRMRLNCGTFTLHDSSLSDSQISLDYGDCNIQNTTLHSLTAELACGDFTAKNTAFLERAVIQNNMGDLTLSLSGTAEEYVILSPESQSTSQQGDKRYIIASTDLGNVDISFTQEADPS